MASSTIAILIIVGVVLLLGLYIIVTYNKFIKLGNINEASFGSMDVYLKKRWDMIPNLVNTVKGYTKHEDSTLKEIIGLRNAPYNSMSQDEKISKNIDLSKAIPNVLALAENYPNLKADTMFKSLMDELSNVEDNIANARKYYNGCIARYNNLVESIPSNIVAKMFGFKKKEMFEIPDMERENVKVEF